MRTASALVLTGLALALAPAGAAGARSCAQAVAAPEQALRCHVNRVRQHHGLEPVAPDRRLVHAAERHAADMAARDYFSHSSPDGAQAEQRVRPTGYLAARRWWLGEVLAWGAGPQRRPRAIVRAWMNSPMHRAVLLDGRYRDAGFGLVRGAPAAFDGRAVTVAAVFGRRSG